MASAAYIKELLQRYENGICTPEEIARLEQWFEQVQLENTTENILAAEDEERIVQRLIAHPRFNAPVSAIERKIKSGIFRLLPRMAAAVWLGMLLTGGLATWFAYQHYTDSVQHIAAFVEIKTMAGQRRKIVLPDSSVVWLNDRSSLSYHPDFAAHRQLRLTGEAFFEVTHDKDHPFTVQAGKAATKVYGTAFNISAYAGASELRIGLQHGSIGITYDSAAANGEKILSPGQLFLYNTTTRTAQILPENAEDMGGWVTGKLIFHQVPLQEVLAQLERRYSITCINKTVLKNPLVTARFENASLEKVLTHLAFGWDVHFKRSNDTLYIE